jgi:ferredoxin-fold anticodon binding domain-containing protein
MKIDPKNIDITKAMQMLNTFNKALSEVAEVKVDDVFKGMEIKKSFPVKINGKSGIINLIADGSVTMKIEGFNEEDLKSIIKKIHD